MSRVIGALNMMGLPQARWIAWGLIFLLSALSTEAIPADEASVAPSAPQEATADGALNSFSADKPFIVALGDPAPPVPRSTSLAPSQLPPASSQWPAPARFFTINQVLAKHKQITFSSPPLHLAAVDPKVMSDASSSATLSSDQSGEPFGLFTFVAPDGLLWSKWRKVGADIRAAEPILTRCLADAKQCSPAAARFSAIVNDAHEQKGRARLELVNQRVNTAIRYKSDGAQWGVPDLWSPPLDASDTGSFSTSFGDCEDYAIAKYVALRAAGVPARQLRVLLVHDNMARTDHAVLAALDDGHWLILDNRWMTLVEDTEARQFAPLFVLDEQGVKLLAVPYAAKHAPMSEAAETSEQIIIPGGEAAEQALTSVTDDVTSIGSAPLLL